MLTFHKLYPLLCTPSLGMRHHSSEAQLSKVRIRLNTLKHHRHKRLFDKFFNFIYYISKLLEILGYKGYIGQISDKYIQKGKKVKGSKKQVALAKDIRAKYVSNAKPLLGKNPHVDRAINSILSINKANFWISNEYSNWRILLKSLYSIGLPNKGDGWSNIIQADRDTHVITETWTEIVPDGKRGQKITKNRIWAA